MLGHVLGKTVHDHAHFHDRAGKRDFFAKNFGAIGRRKDGLADVESDFAAIDIERGDDFDVARPIGADLAMHKADGAAVDPRAPIEIDTLDKGTGAITDTDNGDSNLSHGKKEILPAAVSLGQDTKL